MYRSLFLFVTCIASVLCLWGKDSHYAYTQLSVGEGLSQANIESILLDRRGDLWIGTKNGLNHYAQQKMVNFFHRVEDRNSLPDNHIFHLEEDSLGNIWVATANGLALYDREQRNFNILTKAPINSSLCIRGGVLFGGDNVLYFYRYHTQELERIHIRPEGPQTIPLEYRVQKILPFREDKLLIATRKKGLFTYDCRTQEVRELTRNVPNYLLFSACMASDGCIYASFYGNGVYRFDSEGNILNHYSTANSELGNNYVMDLLEHDGMLWLATDGGGISRIDLDTRQFSRLMHVTGDKTSLPVNSITLLYKDYHGNLWAGSVRGGVFTINDSYIKTFQDVVMNHASGLTEKSVSSIYEEENGLLWIGTDGGGINLYHPETDRFTHFPDTYGDKVVSIAGLSDDELLVSLYTKGLFTFHKKTGKYRRFIVVDEPTNQKECFYGYLPLANQVNQDKIYIISFGAWVYHIPEKTFTPLVLPENSRGKTEALKLAYSNPEFSLLQQGNLSYLVRQEDDSVRLLFEAGLNEEITSMTYDASSRTVWVGTNHGLGYYRLDEGTYRHFPTKLFNSVSYLTLDGEGRLWICAENKLFSYNISEGTFTSWNQSDGYLPNEIQSKFQKTRNKDFLYLCGSQGLVRIARSIQPIRTEQPEIYLSDIHYNGQSSIKQAHDAKFEVPWDYHSIVLTFGVRSEDVFRKHLLKYIIRSSSGEHTFESYEPQLNLSSLSPDTYGIQVSCYTKDGSESPAMHLLTLVVHPPWYKSTGFIVLSVLLLVGATVGIGRWMYQRKARQMKGDVGEFLQTVLHSLGKTDEMHGSSEASVEEVPEESPAEATEPVLSEADQAFLDKMDKLIHDNLSSDELSAKFLTEQLAMSRASLYNKVKALTGMGVNDYINRIRIERSVQLLTTTDMSINEISYEVGFNYPRYFSTSFKQMKGMTPTRFKEENKKRGQATS